MGGSAKKYKKVCQTKEPEGRTIVQGGNPEGKMVVQGGNPSQYYSRYPSWNFSSCDTEKWSIFASETQEIFWTEVFPHLQSWEKMKWSQILIDAKKQNHSLEMRNLNKSAVDRLAEKYIEAGSLISLRLSGTHRVYGFMSGSVFNILWIDLEHGDNETCVCRSRKKNT